MRNYTKGAIFYCLGLSMIGGAFGTVVGNYNQTIIDYAAAALVTLVGVLACIRGSELLKESE
jgi:hypothetical protein